MLLVSKVYKMSCRISAINSISGAQPGGSAVTFDDVPDHGLRDKTREGLDAAGEAAEPRRSSGESISIQINVGVCIYTCMCVYVYIHIHTYMCIYLFMYTYIYIYVYIDVYTFPL